MWLVLRNKTCIVTGSGRGLGQFYAKALGKAGANVVVSDVIDLSESVSKVRETGAQVLGVECDVTDSEQCEKLAREAKEEFGSVDVLVNNAAIYGRKALEKLGADEEKYKIQPLEQISEEIWDKVMDVNVKGVWLASKAVLPYMKEQENGDIINISSAGIFWGIPNALPYPTSKGAVFFMTRSMAAELSGTGIRVNTVTPGFAITQGSKEALGSEEMFEGFKEAAIEKRVIKRDERAEDLVGTIVFLASDKSNFITGQAINVDGGESFH